MPPAIAAALIGLAGTGVTTGLQASGALTPDAPKPVTNPQANPNTQQEQQAFRQAAPMAQEQNPFMATDEGTAALIASMTGNPGDISLAQSTIFGSNPSQPNVFSGGTPGLASTPVTG